MLDSFYTRKLQMLSINTKQLHIQKPRRIAKDSRIIIDLVFSNKKLEVQVSHEFKIRNYVWLKVELNACKSGNIYKEYRNS